VRESGETAAIAAAAGGGTAEAKKTTVLYGTLQYSMFSLCLRPLTPLG